MPKIIVIEFEGKTLEVELKGGSPYYTHIIINEVAYELTESVRGVYRIDRVKNSIKY